MSIVAVTIGRVAVSREDAVVHIDGVRLDRVTEDQVVAAVLRALEQGRGGWIVTPNIDHLQKAGRDRELRDLLAGADLSVADGAPLVWVSRMLGQPLPERVTGADLLWALCRGAARSGRSVYLLGGEPGVPEAAAAVLQEHAPGLRIAGTLSPEFGFDGHPDGIKAVCEQVEAAKPDLVFVGLGFPRQERLIVELHSCLPAAWMLGCGAAIPFAAGAIDRAPGWMGRVGLEWAFRLLSEPRRLARRYLWEDAPYAVRLLAGAAVQGLRHRLAWRRGPAGPRVR
jgi:N-acetylglucosaminyldiphosphoundecaprenol N-acetyl-beta-D-mannosaminyltransferase